MKFGIDEDCFGFHAGLLGTSEGTLLLGITFLTYGLIKDDETPQVGGADLPDETCHTAVTGGGFTMILGPDGRTLAQAADASFEGLIYAELDFNEIYRAKNIVDPVGQYSRTDMFSLRVNQNVNRHCVYGEKTTEFAHASRYPELAKEVAAREVKANEMAAKEVNGAA